MTKITPFTDKALAEVIEILKTVGLNPNHGFEYHAQESKAYAFGGLEWTERFFGTRFYLTLGQNGRVEKINCSNFTEYEAVPKNKLAEVNNKLAEILAKFNN